MNAIAMRIDELGKIGWIGLIVVSFILWWPLGLAALIYTLWSGRMSYWCGKDRSERRWSRMERKWDKWQERAKRWSGGSAYASSGNVAFDDYRDETLRRLEDEQKEFRDFLDRLRKAKDKAEFDEFMSERRAPRAPDPGAGQPTAP